MNGNKMDIWIVLVIIYQGVVNASPIKYPDLATNETFISKNECEMFRIKQNWQTQSHCAKLHIK